MGRREADCKKFVSHNSSSLTFVQELFSLMTLKTYPCSSGKVFDMKNTLNRDYFWRLTLMKKSHVTVTKTPIPAWTPTQVSGHDENFATVECASGRQVHVWSRSQDTWNSDSVYHFTGVPRGLRIHKEPHVNKDSTPVTIFLLFFMEGIQQLVARLINTTINI